jgi:hypothetical protein
VSQYSLVVFIFNEIKYFIIYEIGIGNRNPHKNEIKVEIFGRFSIRDPTGSHPLFGRFSIRDPTGSHPHTLPLSICF